MLSRTIRRQPDGANGRPQLITDIRHRPLGSTEALLSLQCPPGRGDARMWTLEIAGGVSTRALLFLVGHGIGEVRPDGWGTQYQVLWADGTAYQEAAFVGLFTLIDGHENTGGAHAAFRAALSETAHHPSIWRWVVLS